MGDPEKGGKQSARSRGKERNEMHELTDDRKFEVLMAQIQERYSAAHQIRERGTQFTIWISGLGIGLAWLLVSEGSLTLVQRGALTVLTLALFGGAIYFLLALDKGFCRNREVIIALENALRLHEAGVYLPDKPLLPGEYAKTNGRWTHLFCTLRVWLVLTALSLLVLTWACPREECVPPSTQQTR